MSINRIRNLTPHPVVLNSPQGGKAVIRPHGEALRIVKGLEPFGHVSITDVGVVPLMKWSPPTGEAIHDLNTALVYHLFDGVDALIIPTMMLEFVYGVHWQQVFAPDTSTGGCVRDRNGKVLAVHRLVTRG